MKDIKIRVEITSPTSFADIALNINVKNSKSASLIFVFRNKSPTC